MTAFPITVPFYPPLWANPTEDRHREEDRLTLAMERLKRGTVVQQDFVPDQTALVLRWDLITVRHELIRLRALSEILRDADDRADTAEARVAKLEAALGVLLAAAENMPRRTPAPGGASTDHPFQIMAAHVWANDRACDEARTALASSNLEKGSAP